MKYIRNAAWTARPGTPGSSNTYHVSPSRYRYPLSVPNSGVPELSWAKDRMEASSAPRETQWGSAWTRIGVARTSSNAGSVATGMR